MIASSNPHKIGSQYVYRLIVVHVFGGPRTNSVQASISRQLKLCNNRQFSNARTWEELELHQLSQIVT